MNCSENIYITSLSILTRVWISFTFKIDDFRLLYFSFFFKKDTKKLLFCYPIWKRRKKNSNGTSELSHWNNVCIKIKNLGRKNEKKYIFFVENTWRHSSREWIWQRERDRKWKREKEKEMESEIGLRIPSVIINKYLS